MKQTVLWSKYEDRKFLGILEENQLVELSFLQEEEESILGNIYIGKVKNIVKNINAAFVEIGNDVLCFLSLKENETPFYTRPKKGDKLVEGDEILVQVSQMDVKTKHPMCTSKISISGKYAAFTYHKTGIGVSNKIPKDEKTAELRKIAEKYLEDHHSIVLRTNSYYATFEEVEQELAKLKAEFEAVLTKARTRSLYSLIRKEDSQVIKTIKDLKENNEVELITDLKEVYDEISIFLKEDSGQEHPEQEKFKLQFYQDENLSLLSLYSLQSKISNALKKRVWMKSGAYLVIEQTEAMVVIDVNTGKALNKKKREEHFLNVNLEAAVEIAKQIRLRNLSGIIIVDFIDLEKEEDTKKLLKVFDEELQKDRIKTTLVDITKLHLVEVTRKKTKKSLLEQYYGNWQQGE